MGRFRYVLWTGLVLLLVVGLLFGLVALRRIGHGESLTELIARHEAEGRGTTVEALLDREPQLDPAVQARARAWMERRVGPGIVNFHPSRPVRWFLEGAVQPPEELRKAHDGAREDMEELAEILAESRLCVSSLGWLREALAKRRPETRGFANWLDSELPGGWQLLEAASWFQVQALRGDVDAGLASLDRLQRAHRPFSSPIDAMHHIGLAAKRDHTYLALAIGDRLPTSMREAWLAEPPMSAASLAAAYRGTRILYTLPLARAAADGDIGAVRRALLHSPDGIGERIDYELYLRWDAATEAARAVDLKARIADVLRDPLTYPRLAETDRWLSDAGPLLRVELNMWRHLIRGYFTRTTMHRAARLAVRALDLHRRGLLPTDEVALREALGPHAAQMDPGPWSLALRYERPGADRLRFSVDPEGALPAYVRPEEAAVYRGSGRFGSKPLDAALELDDKGVLLRLP